MSAMQFFFMFSAGEYSDYGVGGIFVCDHPVTKDDWQSHYAKYRDERCKRSFNGSNMTFGEWYDSGRAARLERWEKKNDPEKTFQKLHNMKPVEYLEFWRDA